MTNLLAPLGMSEIDSAVYEYLLKRGQPVGASKVATALSIHRQYAHTSLKKLVASDLVERIQGVRPKYQALPPRYVTQRARKQFEEAERSARALESISNIGADQEFEVYRGAQQIIDSESNLVQDLPYDATQYIIGGGAKAYMHFWGDQYEEVTRVAEEKSLKTMYVGCAAELPYLARAQSVLKDFAVRTLNGMPETSVQTVIRLDTVTFYSFGTPPLVYVLKSKTVYEDYKKFFFMLWDRARP